MKKTITLLIAMLLSNSCFSSIIGTWKKGNLLLKYEPDGSHFACSIDTVFSLSNNGSTLILGPSTYTRLSGADTTSVVGHWQGDDEEIYYRSDGRYITLFDGEPLVYFGTYTVTGKKITDCDYRGRYSLVGDVLTQFVYWGGPVSTKVSITPGVKIEFPGGNTWTWVP